MLGNTAITINLHERETPTASLTTRQLLTLVKNPTDEGAYHGDMVCIREDDQGNCLAAVEVVTEFDPFDQEDRPQAVIDHWLDMRHWTKEDWAQAANYFVIPFFVTLAFGIALILWMEH